MIAILKKLLEMILPPFLNWLYGKARDWIKDRAAKAKRDKRIDETVKKVEGAGNEKETDEALDSISRDFND